MYNATAYKMRDDAIVATEAVEVDDEGRVLRACGLWSHLNGTPAYDAAWRSEVETSTIYDTVRIERDGAAGYRRALGCSA